MVKLALRDRTGADSQALVRAQFARLLPVVAALDDRLRVTSGFEHTLILWRYEAMTAAIRFLETLTAGQVLPLGHHAVTAHTVSRKERMRPELRT